MLHCGVIQHPDDCVICPALSAPWALTLSDGRLQLPLPRRSWPSGSGPLPGPVADARSRRPPSECPGLDKMSQNQESDVREEEQKLTCRTSFRVKGFRLIIFGGTAIPAVTCLTRFRSTLQTLQRSARQKTISQIACISTSDDFRGAMCHGLHVGSIGHANVQA